MNTNLIDTVHNTDLLTLCSMCDPQSIDMILCDLPYGAIGVAWDEIIPFEPMWAEFKRVIKQQGAIVLTATQPFASRLLVSNLSMFRYDWVWTKSMPTQYPNANRRPLAAHESVLVFSMSPANGFVAKERSVSYYPQFEAGAAYFKRNEGKDAYVGYPRSKKIDKTNEGYRYPTTVLKMPNSNHGSLHPTQKPVALFEYLIRTYTREGETVLDPCCGSGTTAIAARNTGRHYICGDITAEYVEVARKRLRDTDPYQHRELPNGTKQLSMFSK